MRDSLHAHLADRSIGSAIYYPIPLHLQDAMAGQGYAVGDYPVSEAACADVLSLPIFPELTPQERGLVIDAVLEHVG